ncbi:sugar phosphate isomerase/epimerase family protein [Blautia sp.]|uniref:sugar phosphate isomerase/epimerase family protein n=1 Tax=Blautia sp. TaxID=1955243 RepID=UPI003AB78FCC
MDSLKRNQIAVMNIQYKFFPLTKFLDDAVKNEVECIELWGAAPHFHPEDMTYYDITSVRHEIETRNLKLICYTPEQCIYPINLAAPYEAERRRSLKFFEDAIRVSSELGTDKMLVTVGTGYFDGSDYEEAWKYGKEGLMQLGDMAEHYDITLALEVWRKDETNLINDLSSLQKMMRELEHKNIGAMLDTIPMVLENKTPKDYLDVFGERLVHVHFVDGAPRGHLAWGDGILDMEGYLGQFDEYGYKNSLSLEITDGRYLMNPEKSIQQSVKRLFSVIK